MRSLLERLLLVKPCCEATWLRWKRWRKTPSDWAITGPLSCRFPAQLPLFSLETQAKVNKVFRTITREFKQIIYLFLHSEAVVFIHNLWVFWLCWILRGKSKFAVCLLFLPLFALIMVTPHGQQMAALPEPRSTSLIYNSCIFIYSVLISSHLK